MPAAEAIYSPYDFRYIYHQKQMELDSDVFFALKRDKKPAKKKAETGEDRKELHGMPNWEMQKGSLRFLKKMNPRNGQSAQ